MTPTEFEIYCITVLRCFARESGIVGFQAQHNQKITVDDGTYQIDILAKARIMRINIQIICECKMYKKPIERSVVVELHGKVNSLAANIGILISTSPFQSGAVQYAIKHGLKLIQLKNPDDNSGGGSAIIDSSRINRSTSIFGKSSENIDIVDIVDCSRTSIIKKKERTAIIPGIGKRIYWTEIAITGSKEYQLRRFLKGIKQETYKK